MYSVMKAQSTVAYSWMWNFQYSTLMMLQHGHHTFLWNFQVHVFYMINYVDVVWWWMLCYHSFLCNVAYLACDIATLLVLPQIWISCTFAVHTIYICMHFVKIYDKIMQSVFIIKVFSVLWQIVYLGDGVLFSKSDCIWSVVNMVTIGPHT